MKTSITKQFKFESAHSLPNFKRITAAGVNVEKIKLWETAKAFVEVSKI